MLQVVKTTLQACYDCSAGMYKMRWNCALKRTVVFQKNSGVTSTSANQCGVTEQFPRFDGQAMGGQTKIVISFWNIKLLLLNAFKKRC